MNPLTFDTLVGTSHSSIFFLVVSVLLNLPLPTVNPRNSVSGLHHSHLLIFTFKPASFINSKACFTCTKCSSYVFEYTITSSIYACAQTLINGASTCLINL